VPKIFGIKDFPKVIRRVMEKSVSGDHWTLIPEETVNAFYFIVWKNRRKLLL
jgi:hypothetical protein